MWRDRVAEELASIAAAGRWRSTRSFDAHGPRGALAGRDVVSFGGNDYLGLSAHPAVIEAAVDAARRWGTGSTSARLLVGTRPVHHDLEAALAEWKGTEAAAVLPTGYQANLAVLGALGQPDVTIFSDELNHASIIDGCRLSRATTRVFRHRDLDHLEAQLRDVAGPRIVVTDTVFSMDGDCADIDALATLCGAHDALLVLDEAHAVLGPHIDVASAPCDIVRVGTLSKTLGALGGFVAASGAVTDLIVNRARSYIFTTALSPTDAAAALAALGVLRGPDGTAALARLAALVATVQPGHPSPIVPILIGPEDAALAATDALLARGLYVPAVRPPTVAPGTSRLRVALSSSHTDADVQALVDALTELGLRT